jgi:hypothetical protein
MTIRAGKIVFDLNARAGLPWRNANNKRPKRSIADGLEHRRIGRPIVVE